MTKELSYVMLEPHNVRMKLSNVRKKKKEITKCEKKTVTCEVETAQCEDETVKCEKKITWCNRLLTSGYRTPSFFKGYRRITLEFYIVIGAFFFVSVDAVIITN